MISRRQWIRTCGIAIGGLAVSADMQDVLLTSAERVRAGSRDAMEAFARTVIPDLPDAQKHITNVLGEKIYGFRKYKWLILTDLSNRSRRLFGDYRFYALNSDDRKAVISDALESNGLFRKLYSGAIQILQLTYYSGYNLEPEQCRRIGFKARYEYSPRSHESMEHYFANTMTYDGNLS